MSFPPGTEIFQFPGFASPHYGFMWRYPKGVGCPIRTSTDQRLLAAPRGFSQRATSFIASWCQGIHRMPFSRSRSSSPDQSPGTSTMHRNHPQPSLLTGQWSIDHHPPNTNNQATIPHKTDHSRSAHNSRHLNVHPARWRPPRRRSNTSGQTREQARPETHQNLIHPDKDQRLQPETPTASQFHPEFQAQNHQCRFLSLLRDTVQPTQHLNPNQDRGGGDRTRTDDPLLAKQVLSQLSYTPQTQERWWAREDLNLRPHAYQACALTS